MPHIAHPAPHGRYGARQSTLREGNLALVTRTVLLSPDPLSRAGVAAATSMTRSTVSRLVDDLVAAGILDELEPVTLAGPGRPATPLVAGAGLAALGLQVDPNCLVARMVDLRGRVVAEEVRELNLVGSDPAQTLSRLRALCRKVGAKTSPGPQLVGAGLALPGIVAVDEGRLLTAPNLGWSNVDPRDVLGAALGGLNLRIGNEADLAARAVAEPAPGRPGQLTDFIYLSGEIGIGGAVVVDGLVMTGRHGWAGEIGHVCVDPDGPPCRCGSTGCLERYAGRQAILAAAGLSLDATAADLARRLTRSDTARHAVEAAATALGIALASVVNVLDIPTVVLGGHLGQLAEHLRPGVERQLRDRVLSARWACPSIVTVDGQQAPGATGAALQELSAVLDNPARWLARTVAQEQSLAAARGGLPPRRSR